LRSHVILNDWLWLSDHYSLLLDSWLSHTVANRFYLWTHILLLKDLLVLDQLIEAKNEEELAKTVPENITEALTDDLVPFEVLGLFESNLLISEWELIKPFLVWVNLRLLLVLWFIHNIIFIHWLLFMMFMMSMVGMMSSMMTPKLSFVDNRSGW